LNIYGRAMQTMIQRSLQIARMLAGRLR
jgi:hypothetical protein